MVPILEDTLDESDETFTVTLANPNANATIADGTGPRDNHGQRRAAWTLSINDVTVDEGALARGSDIHGDFERGERARGDRRLRNGRRLGDGWERLRDAASGGLVFTAGETTKAVTVTVNGDLLDEVNETLLPRSLEPGERGARRRPGAWHDHGRRPCSGSAAATATATAAAAAAATATAHGAPAC